MCGLGTPRSNSPLLEASHSHSGEERKTGEHSHRRQYATANPFPEFRYLKIIQIAEMGTQEQGNNLEIIMSLGLKSRPLKTRVLRKLPWSWVTVRGATPTGRSRSRAQMVPVDTVTLSDNSPSTLSEGRDIWRHTTLQQCCELGSFPSPRLRKPEPPTEQR